jgi:flagellar hook-basal body complex protein FliE
MIRLHESTETTLLELAKKKVYLEGNIIKLIETDSKEFKKYLVEAKNKDSDTRKRRLQVTKQVQLQNKELTQKQSENDKLMEELHIALEEAKNAEWEADKLREEAEKGKEKALGDLDLMQRKSQFELIGTIVKVALFVIIGVGTLTTVMYGMAIAYDKETQIIGSTWSNMFGILLTNAFSIVGTIMGVKYANDSVKDKE